MRFSRLLLTISLVLCLSHFAFGDDNPDAPARKFPNRIETTNPPDDSPHVHVTTVPQARAGTTGSAASPENGSAMGLGISIPLGRPKKSAVKPKELEDQAPNRTG